MRWVNTTRNQSLGRYTQDSNPHEQSRDSDKHIRWQTPSLEFQDLLIPSTVHSSRSKMLGPALSAVLSTLLLASAIMPSGAMASVQHSWMPLDKRAHAPHDGSECFQNFATDPQKCSVVHVAFFEDDKCGQPLDLVRTTPYAFIKNRNEQMLFDGMVAHSLKKPFGSMRVLAAVDGIGIGFAKEEESDGVVQNMAWMSSAQTYSAFTSKECITLPNLDTKLVGVWSVKLDNTLNQAGYVWNPDNIPLIRNAAGCQHAAIKKHRKRLTTSAYKGTPACLEPASYGGGGVLLMYATDDCSGDPKDTKAVRKQLYSTVQCTPLSMTGFKSYKAVQPKGPTIDTIFSPLYYDLNENGYHRCAQRDVSARPFRPNECQKVAGNDMFVGVYGNDPGFPQPPPESDVRVLLRSTGRGPHQPPRLGPKGVAFTGP